MANREMIIKSTHRGLRYVDGRFTGVLEAGRYKLPRPSSIWIRRPKVEIVAIDMRERELTIKGQEILTSDKVAVRVSILTQFRVVDPVAAAEKVASYEDCLYSDVQLAARRSLASMTLEAILTNRNSSPRTSWPICRASRAVMAWRSFARTSRTSSSPATCRTS